MKKILLVLLFVITFIKADGANSYNEYKIDLYYANGIMMQDDEVESEEIWERKSEELLSKYSILT